MREFLAISKSPSMSDMTGCRFRITTWLLLLATIICGVSIGSVKAEAVPARVLRDQVQQNDADLHLSASTPSFDSNNSHASNTGSIDDTNASIHAATEPGHKETDLDHKAVGSSDKAHGSGSETSGSGHKAVGPSEKAHGSGSETSGSGHEAAKPAHEAPTFMMFMGPAIAGVMAVVLIGCIIAFKNRKGK